MSRWITSFAVLCVMLALTLALRADNAAAPAADKQEAKEAKAEAREAKKEVRLTQPWRRLSNLSEDQRVKIAEIHKKAIADIKEIEAREREEIMALLSEEQKTELKTLLDTESAERKMRAAERKKSGEATSEEKPAETTTPGAGN